MRLSNTESAIGLYAYHAEPPAAYLYADFYSLVLESLSKLGVQPTYVGPSGEGYPEDYVKFGGKAHRRLIAANFQDIHGLSVAANPPESNTPAYDNFFEGVISFTPTSGFPESTGGVVYSYFVINEIFLPFGNESFERILKEMVNLYPWSFGMGFTDTVDRHPEYHIGELSHDALTTEEKEAGNIWYNTPPEKRVQTLRTVYLYNVLNSNQLSQPTSSGSTLRDYIRQESIGTLELLANGRLHLWKVFDEKLRHKTREFLKQSGLVLY